MTQQEIRSRREEIEAKLMELADTKDRLVADRSDLQRRCTHPYGCTPWCEICGGHFSAVLN